MEWKEINVEEKMLIKKKEVMAVCYNISSTILFYKLFDGYRPDINGNNSTKTIKLKLYKNYIKIIYNKMKKNVLHKLLKD